ncbi:hypothetical protein Glove_60g101 [Diversispora epigaea]|uniref:Uncharacterized protein n=1 Tax=Diversispora epigaea TaxID=1348612 RepID=A0A397JIL5_9GLOM|nr:hypothetical protein Glove_60g101 [Diversispora epigaea]
MAILRKFDDHLTIHLRTGDNAITIGFYDITKDSETYKYIMVLDHLKDGNPGMLKFYSLLNVEIQEIILANK